MPSSNPFANLSGIKDKSSSITGTVGSLLAVCWAAVFIRIYARHFVLKKFHTSDYLIVLTQIFQTCQAAYIFIGVRGGLGNPNFLPTQNAISSVLFNQLLIELFFCIACSVLRISIGLQLWPIIAIQSTVSRARIQRYIVLATVTIMMAFGIAWFFVLLFQCSPVHYFWDRVYFKIKGTCLPIEVQAGMAYTQAILSALADFVLGLLPIWIVWHVEMPKRLKISIASLLGIGISAGVVSVVRMIYTRHLIYESSSFFADPAPIVICGFLEVSLGVLATCIATYKPLFARSRALVKSYLQSRSGSQSASKSGSKSEPSPEPKS